MSSIVFYGRPGTGKSTLAASFTKLGYHVHFIDVDRKVKSMRNLQPLLENGSVSYEEIDAPLVEGKLRGRVIQLPKAPVIMPKGYVRIAELMDRHAENPLPNAHKTVLVLDSMTAVNGHLKRLIKNLSKKSKLSFDEWDAILVNYEELFGCFFALQPSIYAHCVVIAHAKDEKDEVLGDIEAKPLLDGQMRDKLGSLVEEMYWTYVDATKSGPAKFRVLTKPVGRVSQARSSFAVNTVMDADMSIIFQGERAPE